MIDRECRAFLLEIAEKIDSLGQECADSLTVVLSGGETITYAAVPSG